MNLFVATILIPLLLVSQSLFSVAHSHAGTSVAEPDGHAARPHVHLPDAHQHHGQHEDGDETQPSPVQQVPDHDSSAVYAGDIQLLHDSKVARVATAELTASNIVWGETSAIIVLWRSCTQLTSPPIQRPKCARYLQFHAILC